MEKIIDEKQQGNSLVLEPNSGNGKKLMIESYGCQMNFSDSEIVASILAKEGFDTTQNLEEADLVLINTCSIRDKAEQTVRKRLEKYNAVKKINRLNSAPVQSISIAFRYLLAAKIRMCCRLKFLFPTPGKHTS